MARSKSQKVTVSLTFDKPVTKVEAVKEFRDSVHGTFYYGYVSVAEEFRIRGVSHGPKTYTNNFYFGRY